ncbi:MAG: BREX system P-loop protein BrxC [Vicinamibacterales bacterium]
MTKMPTIQPLFSRELNRPIEKVITYHNRSTAQLKAEVSEYVVTEHIEEEFEKLLTLMQAALQAGGGNEIGVWVSGFYGSGKSSFTKYLGFALDRGMKVEGDLFLHLLQNQLRTAAGRALFNQVSTTYDPAVVLLDLASEMLAGASMEDVSTVLYLKVLQWAGYSEDLKVAELERMLERDAKLAAFEGRAAQELGGIAWSEVHNQPLVANPIAARLASEFYPLLYQVPEDFQRLSVDVKKSEVKRVEEMIDLIRRKSGKKHVIFIVDEVGQYVSAKPSLILNLDGLAKNLKQVGGGQVWLFATAQQTLTEDSPVAMFNAPGLFKLKDRFPIQINLEASDIREICHRRLLTKSASGEDALGRLFDTNGASLRTATQLKDGGVYDAALDRRTFINLYPFLPQHFEILLQLLGRLARKTGGLGLRSAIKVVQDVLVDRGGRKADDRVLADEAVGTLATTVTFYDSLRRDIQSSYAHIAEGVKRVEDRFVGKSLHGDVAKSIAILQILENLPVTSHNIAALLQSSVEAASLREQVASVVDELLKDPLLPLGEKNGSLRFLTQAAVTLQKQFDQIEYRNADVRAEVSRAVRNLLTPLPSARLNGVRPVSAGVRLATGGGQSVALEGEREPIQLHVEFVPPSAYEQTRAERENDSRARQERTSIWVVGKTDPAADQLAVTLVRCQKFIDIHRSASDPETQEFVRIVSERRDRAGDELEGRLRGSLFGGSFVAHGEHRPVSELAPDVGEACKAYLGTAAGRVFDQYGEAPVQADAGAAEKFLKTPLSQVKAADDPLTLIKRTGATVAINGTHKACVSIKDYLRLNGQVEGRRLLEHFNAPPFGWSKDTTRYLLVALFVAGELRFRIAGQDHVVKSDESVNALCSNKALGPVGIGLRDEPPDPERLMRASERLRELTGEDVLLLEDELATAAKKHFPTFQQAYGALGIELRSLGLEGGDRANELLRDLTEVIRGDGSDAINRLGGIESPLGDSLKWARKISAALANGMRETVTELQRLSRAVAQLPDTGVPGRLKVSAAGSIADVRDVLAREEFFSEGSTLARAKKELEQLVSTAVADLIAEQKSLCTSELEKWQGSSDWADLSADDRQLFVSNSFDLAKEAPPTLTGLQQLLTQSFDLHNGLREIERSLKMMSDQRRLERVSVSGANEEAPTAPGDEETLMVPDRLTTVDEIDALIKQLQHLRIRVASRPSFRVVWKQVDSDAV